MKVRRQSSAYTEHRQTPAGAADHSTKYEQQFHKRMSNRRERDLLSRILLRMQHRETLLDVPSGAGRLADVFLTHCGELCEVDASAEMLHLLRERTSSHATGVPLGLGVASAFHLPFRDRSFDAVASLRLSHHIADLEGRLWHLNELLRVARHHVLLSFFDARSFKNRLRELRRGLGSSKRSKYTLSRTTVTVHANAAGFGLQEFFSLAPLLSGHTFALLSRP